MGTLISFEGIDGSGKSSVIDGVVKALKKAGHTVIAIREPGESPLGEAIRKLLKSDMPRTKRAELLLYEASRADAVETIVRPALAEYDFVIMDRYVDSTVAYQSYGNGTSQRDVNRLNTFATHGLLPKHRFLIDVPMKVADERRRGRGIDQEGTDKYDADRAYARKVYYGYQKLVSDGVLTPIENIDLESAVKNILAQVL